MSQPDETTKKPAAEKTGKPKSASRRWLGRFGRICKWLLIVLLVLLVVLIGLVA